MFGAPKNALKFRYGGKDYIVEIDDDFRVKYAKAKHAMLEKFSQGKSYEAEARHLIEIILGLGAPGTLFAADPKHPLAVLGKLLPWTTKKLEPRLKLISHYRARKYLR